MSGEWKTNLRKLKQSKNDFVRSLYALADRQTKDSVKNTVIIDGFWRSGTTWAQTKVCTSVRGKSIFEPLFPDAADDSVYANSGLEKSELSHGFLHSFMPYVKEDGPSAEFDIFLTQCFNGDIKSSWARRLRSSVFASFNETVVCKFVRAHLLLPNLLETDPNRPVIHIFRNPKPIIASITRNDWGAWLDDFYLKDHFLDIDDGRTEYFDRYRSLIEKYDQMGLESRICAFWCLSEKYIQDTCSGKKNFLSVSYEDLSVNGFDEVANFLSSFGYSWQENSKDESNSDTTVKKRKSLSKEEKRESWRKELDVEIQEKIDTILADFGINRDFEMYLKSAE